MNKQQLCDYVRFLYPNSVGALLTGSQRTNAAFKISSDIDVVIIDPTFSIISSHLTSFNGIQFDFTQIPLFNLEYFLLSESTNLLGIILDMIMKGEILFEKYSGFLTDVINYTKYIFSDSTFSKVMRFNDSVAGLRKIHKHFKEYQPHEKFFLLMEFFNLAVRSKLYGSNLIPNIGVYTARLLNDHDPDFVVKLTNLVKNELLNTGSGTEVFNYITDFLDQHTITQLSLKELLVLDITYPSFSLENFIKDVLPEIKVDNTLGKHFIYFYRSNSSYPHIYKNQLSLVFENRDAGQFSACVTSVGNILKLQSKQPYKIEITPTLLHDHRFRNSEFNAFIYRVCKENNDLVERLILERGAWDADQSILYGLLQVAYVAFRLNFESDDLLNVNLHICNAYLFTRKEQSDITHPGNLLDKQRQKFVEFNKYYLKEKSWIDKVLEKANLLKHDLLQADQKDYYKLMIALDNLLSNCQPSFDFYMESFTNRIFNEHLKVKNLSSSVAYVNIVELVFLSMGLNPQTCSLIMFLFSTSFHSLNFASGYSEEISALV